MCLFFFKQGMCHISYILMDIKELSTSFLWIRRKYLFMKGMFLGL